MNENDLPITANTNEMLVTHFILDLSCDLEAKVMRGHITLFLDPSQEKNMSRHVFSIQEYQASLIESCQNYQNSLFPRTEYSTKFIGDYSNRLSCSSSEESTLLNPQSHTSIVSAKSQISGSTEDENIIRDGISSNCSNLTSMNNDPAFYEELSSSGKYDSFAVSFGNKDFQSSSDLFQLVLEAYDLDVSHVEKVLLPNKLSQRLFTSQHMGLDSTRNLYLEAHSCTERKHLSFKMEKWSLTIWESGVSRPSYFPRVLCIHYSTKPRGTSLRWATDQDGMNCVYSASMWINNRALFPCQEYGALSTWQIYMTAQEGLSVLATGDEEPHQTQQADGTIHWYQENSMPLPSFCLALAVGSWKYCDLYKLNEECHAQEDHWVPEMPCEHKVPCMGRWSSTAVLPCRLFAPACLLEKAHNEVQEYYPKCCKAIQKLLGACPFRRIDLLLLPACSQDMAMSNPGLIFLSQTLFAGDSSMLIRLGHEISHSWFGLLIGARDWTEEWLSEGFATYVEDAIHAQTLGWDSDALQQFGELRAILRYRVLEGEMETTSDQLQTLRPNQGEFSENSEDKVTFIKDGINPNKLFTQVHYLKGYFLLRDMEARVGLDRFMTAVKLYIVQYHGCLVLSKDFLKLVFQIFPELRESNGNNKNLDCVYREWLDSPGMPELLKQFSGSLENSLTKQVDIEVNYWKSVNIASKRKRKHKKHGCSPEIQCEVAYLKADQIVLILEELLTLDRLTTHAMTQINNKYNIGERNADVKHRWCELVIKHHCHKHYKDLKDFLVKHQAMGVYLYGEMVLSGCRKQKCLAKECFAHIRTEMEPGTRNMVHSMLYGQPESSATPKETMHIALTKQ